MTTGPGDGRSLAQGGRGRMRASHNDREQVITALKAARPAPPPVPGLVLVPRRKSRIP